MAIMDAPWESVNSEKYWRGKYLAALHGRQSQGLVRQAAINIQSHDICSIIFRRYINNGQIETLARALLSGDDQGD